MALFSPIKMQISSYEFVWIFFPFAQIVENTGLRVLLTFIASVISAYAQNPPPLSLEQWWKPPPKHKNVEEVKS